MRNSFLFAVLLQLAWWVLASSALAGQPLSVEVAAKTRRTAQMMTFVIKNVSDHVVVLEEWRLPWGQRQSVMVVAAERKSGAPLKEATQIDDIFLSPKVNLKPGETLSGDIDLSHYVANIGQKLNSTDLVLFWYYNSQGVAGPLGQYGGWLILPRMSR